MMREQSPSWREREHSEEILYEDHEADSSDHLLFTEKDQSPLRHVANISTRISRRTVGILAALGVLVLIGLATLQTPIKSKFTNGSATAASTNATATATATATVTVTVTPGTTQAPSKALSDKFIPVDGMPTGFWKKPQGFKIQGIVFYGRRVHVDILDCYLQQNLAKNGGYLDGVTFLQNTDDKDDLAYLEEILARESDYTRIDVGADVRHWKHMWDQDFDENTMYFKIDDDVVYIHPDAIPQMVHTLLAHPEAHNVQANIVNSASTSWQHYHSGAVRPYLPEKQSRPRTNGSHETWRPSQLPSYPSETAKDKYDFEEKLPPNGHRWLPMEPNSAALMKTPIQQCENYAWGRDWTQWAIGAQHHYSLFNNLEEDDLDVYMFGNARGIWNTGYERYKINLMGIWGKTLNLKKVIEDDEREFTEEFPLEFKMPVLVQTKAIVAHFSFEPQRNLYRTDLLSRYRAYANEKVCAPNNQKSEFPDWQKTLEKWGVPNE